MSSPEFKSFEDANSRERLDSLLIINRNVMTGASLRKVSERLDLYQTYILVEDEDILAVASLTKHTTTNVFLELMAVDETRRRKGIGSRLLGLIENKLAEEASGDSVLISTKPYKDVAGFYEEHGYKCDSSSPRYHHKRLQPPKKGNDNG